MIRVLLVTLFTAAACGSVTLTDECSADSVCDLGGSFKLCTTNQATGAYYVARAPDGEEVRFTCINASDCGKATQEVVDWCKTH